MLFRFLNLFTQSIVPIFTLNFIHVTIKEYDVTLSKPVHFIVMESAEAAVLDDDDDDQAPADQNIR